MGSVFADNEAAGEVSDRFRILKRLGTGGFGVVYEVYDRELDVRVALKELSRLDAEALYRFKNEFRSLADVSHPNLVRLHELFSEGGRWYLTMDLVDGVDFLAYVCGQGSTEGISTMRFTAADARGVETPASGRSPAALGPLRAALQQLAAGVRALHEAGKMHRDLKPPNVLVTRDGRVSILDFGLVTDIGALADGRGIDDYVVGTPAYLSPEQFSAQPASAASDWYAVGIMLYEALTGRPPFTGTLSDVIARKLKGDPPDPRAVDPSLPDDLCDLCVGLLARDPAARPGDAEVVEALGAPNDRAAVSEARLARLEDAHFVGRGRHRAALKSAFDAVAGGETVVAHVYGSSGAGKTALVSAFLDGLVRANAAVVLRGRCFERESVPYGALDSLVDTLTLHLMTLPPAQVAAWLPRDYDALARLFPVLRRVPGMGPRPSPTGDPRELRRRAVFALRELLARIGADAPVVLHIDDAQWGDHDSAVILEDLLRPPDSPPLLLVASYRTEDAEASAFVRALRSHAPGEMRLLEVGPLDGDEAEGLAEALLDREGVTADAGAIARESCGSPLFVIELVQEVKAGLGHRDAGAISLNKMLADRILRLPPVARQLLETIAVAGRPVEWGVVSDVVGVPSAAAHDALSRLRAEHLVRTRGVRRSDFLETFHDRVRETVSDALPEVVARQTHASLANALERSGRGDPEALSLHFSMAGDRARARSYAELAARRAAETLAFDRAAALFRLALDLTESPHEARALQADLGDALANAGRGPEAARAYLAAADGASPERVFDLQRRAAEQLLRSGHMDEGREALQAVLGAVGLPFPESPEQAVRTLLLHRGQLLLRGFEFVERDEATIDPSILKRADACWAVSIGLAGIDVVRGAEFQTRHLALALDAGEPYRIARGLALESMSSACESGPEGLRARLLCDRAEQLAARLDRPHARGMVAMAKGYIAYADGRWEACTNQFERAISTFREHCAGSAWEIAFSQIFALAGLWYRGDLHEMRRRAPFWLADARSRGDLYATTSLRTRFMPKLSLAEGDPDAALRETREAIAEWGQSGWHVPHCFAQFAEAEVLLYTGDALAAWRCMSETWKALESTLLFRAAPLLSIGRYHHGQCALAAMDHGVPDLAPIVLSDAEEFERKNAPLPAAWASLLRAGLAARGREPEDAVALYAEAELRLEMLGMGLFAAAAKKRRGEIAGGEQGRALVFEGARGMTERGVRDTARMGAMLVG
ncbi:MAG TPA: protein kinase [Polyangiaceae bacterium]|jgi:tetratricopeptide (TPR) repeat protein